MLPCQIKLAFLPVKGFYYDLELVLPIPCLVVTVINQCVPYFVLLKREFSPAKMLRAFPQDIMMRRIIKNPKYHLFLFLSQYEKTFKWNN